MIKGTRSCEIEQAPSQKGKPLPKATVKGSKSGKK